MARPSKLTREVQQRICDALRGDATLQEAAEYAGVSYETLRHWREKGEADEQAGHATPFSAFSVALRGSKETLKAELVGIALRGARGGQKVRQRRTVKKEVLDKEGNVVELKQTLVVARTLPEDPDLALEILARRWPEEYGRRATVKLEADWKKELADVGLDPDAIFQQLVAGYIAALTSSPGEAPAGRLGSG